MPNSETKSQLDILDYWKSICDHRWLIMGLVFTSIIVTGIVSKQMPKMYESTATLYPIKEPTAAALSGSGGGNKAAEAMSQAGRGASTTTEQVLTEMVKSRLIAEAVVDNLNLIPYYGADSKVAAAEAVRSEVKVKPTHNRSIKLTVLTKDSKKAAEIANVYFKSLNELYQTHTLTTAKRNRIFIDERITDKKKSLIESEKTLLKFREDNGITMGKEQARHLMSQVAGIDQQIVQHEVELAALKDIATPDHPTVQKLTVQLRELRRALKGYQAETARGEKKSPVSGESSAENEENSIFPHFYEVPSLDMEVVRLERQVRIDETVYSTLMGLREQAKIMEMNDIPIIQILDAALPSKVPSQPRPIRNASVAGALALTLGIMLAVLLDYLERLKAQRAGSLRLEGGPDAIYPSVPKHTEHLTG